MVGRPLLRAKKAALAASRDLPLVPPRARVHTPAAPAAAAAPVPVAPRVAADPVAAKFKVGMDAHLRDMKSEQFERLLGLSFDFAEQVMAMELDPDERNFGKLLSVKQSIAASLLTATTRIRAGDLRPAGKDAVADILRRLKDEDDGVDQSAVANDLFS